MAVWEMSETELSRLDVIRDVDRGRMTVAAAAGLLALERRQVFRLLKAFRLEGAPGLISKRRGRPSNRRKPETVRYAALALVRERYADFGPTLAAEKLSELHGITLGRETLRGWMIEAGLWVDRPERKRRLHQPRYRRDCPGELVQIDGSEHRWFEDRGPACTLLVFVDDVTSRIMHLHFVQTESTFAYFDAARGYLERHGRPVAFYSDKHSVFRMHQTGALSGDGLTQFGRALRSLNIDIICANSSQAKGRVERANKTLQDRLVKELRLAGVSDMEAANAFAPRFLESYNARFAKAPANAKDLHRALRPKDDLDQILAWRELRHVSQNLTLQYDKVLFILDDTPEARDAMGQKVEVIDLLDGGLEIRHKGALLPYRIFDKVRRVEQAEIVDNKRLGAALEYCRQLQAQREPAARSKKAPTRRNQRPSRVFATG